MTVDLQAAIENAYTAFSPHRIGNALVVCHCNCCMTEETERELTGTPLRQIRAGLLAEYTNSAHSWDDDAVAREMRHFLPRYFELIAAGDPPDNLGLDICLRRLGYARWREAWPRDEVEATGGALLHSPFFEEHRDAAGKIGEFLIQPEVSDRIEAAFFATQEPRLQQILSDGR